MSMASTSRKNVEMVNGFYDKDTLLDHAYCRPYNPAPLYIIPNISLYSPYNSFLFYGFYVSSKHMNLMKITNFICKDTIIHMQHRNGGKDASETSAEVQQ